MITFNGRSTDDFNMTLQRDASFRSPSRNLESKKVLGVDGELKIGDGTLNNVIRAYTFIIRTDEDQDVSEVVSELSAWLKADDLWHDFKIESDAEFVYQAICIGEFDVDRIHNNYGRVTISFEFKPYKFHESGLKTVLLTNTIKNNFDRPSKPKMRIYGNGDINIKIGSQVLKLLNVVNGVEIDTLRNTALSLDGNYNAWGNVSRESIPLLTIPKGEHNVTVNGNVTMIEIMPRWEQII